ncbi:MULTISPECIES: hypothetical protein [unclassified Sporosarcina]|uniref:hypothetical protein n=1 Tax=unclassified Sporosarcina TaxID=2647733 RepID=UPI000C164E43|nr:MULTISPECIES: hypothetical protein [unclassified Sporosarcina]PIC86983.1 hypothetical protein CSV72_06295 [Sporosarcina sp. P20a]PIC99022.1 hypothetical protein CSV68_10495 [Sporosarcina sp. P29]PID05700.1 hypothetical protein CSV66_08955 [Sporosarcina sp. P30]PID08894.1 hypothetical protein CSV65_08955 [Sporosarcina sp. P31]PID11885.1 hypothetical protein CSV64_09975 [Sporosarcina sp. P32b]
MQEKWSLRLIRIAAIFGLIGTVLGSHMAGAGSYAFRPIHAHILLVGWLSVFSWGVFYKIYRVRARKLLTLQGWTGIIGAIGLTAGMWLQFMQPFNINEVFALIFYIVGGTVLLVSFALFVVVTFMIEKTPATRQ